MDKRKNMVTNLITAKNYEKEQQKNEDKPGFKTLFHIFFR